MNLEDTLARTFETRLDAVEVPPGDVDGARSAGRRMRVRRRVAAGLGAAVVVAAGVAGIVVSGQPHAHGPTGGTGQWRQLPTPPLSPRTQSISVWTGREVLVLGGNTEPCPPAADGCAVGHVVRDGAAYDPATDTWRRIAPAPDGLLSVTGAVVASGRVVVGGDGTRWATYDPTTDRWTTVPTARGVGDPLSALGDSVYALRHGRVVELDVGTSRWRTLPPDPNLPRLTDKTVTATNAGPVVVGHTYDTGRPIDATVPWLALADVWNGTSWQRLPPSDQLGIHLSWTGRRMVDPNPGSTRGYDDGDGGVVHDWGRAVARGGTLEPTTGAWGSLPPALTGDPRGWQVSAAGGSWFAVAGQVYDDDTGGVWSLPRPAGAPAYQASAAWADGRLLVFGGVDDGDGTGVAVTNHAWLWSP